MTIISRAGLAAAIISATASYCVGVAIGLKLLAPTCPESPSPSAYIERQLEFGNKPRSAAGVQWPVNPDGPVQTKGEGRSDG